jgi:hypothetical protein
VDISVRCILITERKKIEQRKAINCVDDVRWKFKKSKAKGNPPGGIFVGKRAAGKNRENVADNFKKESREGTDPGHALKPRKDGKRRSIANHGMKAKHEN